jgi:hypothetical protein
MVVLHVVTALKQSSQALVWLPKIENNDVRGLETPSLKIDPSIGAEWDRANRNAILWISAGLFGIGSVLIVIVRFSKTGYEEETQSVDE